MNLTKLQDRASTWNKAYKSKRKRTPEYTITHMVEEFGEIAADWRSGNIGRTYKKDEYGLDHPEGLGSEISDLIIIAVCFAEMNGLDIADDVACKLAYLEEKLKSKQAVESFNGKVKKK